jgi:hypothetical protein
MYRDFHAIPDYGSLCAALRGFDMNIPPRSGGRNKQKHTEPSVAYQLLATLGKAGRLGYPVSLTQRDKPDFLSLQGNKEIGIEVSHLEHAGYSHYTAVAEEREPATGLLEPGHFRFGDPVRTREEVKRLLSRPRLSARPYYGNEPEQEWAQFAAKGIESKMRKLARPDFEKFDENWLALYDNLPMRTVRLNEAVSILRPMLSGIWAQTPIFDAIFIEHGPFIIKLMADYSERLIVEDLWKR